MTETFSITEYKKALFEVSEVSFKKLAQKAFLFQLSRNEVLKQFCGTVHYHFSENEEIVRLAFLPIRFFKTHPVIAGDEKPTLFFESSGTTGQVRSRHFVKDPALYEHSLSIGFEKVFGAVNEWQILALLPGYLEQPHSSLVYMMRHLMKQGKNKENNFYLHQYEPLFHHLKKSETEGVKTLLVGVTHALLDFSEKYPIQLNHSHVLETGGMKGRRKEMVREEVHLRLKDSFGLEYIYSEYGMTELLSQAYSLKDGIFSCPPWMRVLVRDEDDPFQVKTTGRGALNIIDLANIHSCCFIATDDIGEVYEDGSFRVLGRMDQSELRGCSLMAV